MLKNYYQSLKKYNISSAQGSSERLLSIDALRGFDMFWIAGGEGIFKSLDMAFHNSTTQFISLQLEHVEWLGFRFYDIIMPLFLFIVGVAMPFSFSKRLAAGESKASVMSHVFKRVIILWILGMMVQGNLLSYHFPDFKFYSNTLQAIAAGYLISSILILYTGLAFQISGTLCLMLVYWLVLAFFPVPGGKGLYLPDHNAALYIDKLILGKYQDGTTYTWIISSLNFAATTMLGIFSGYILKSPFSKYRKVIALALFGIVCFLFAIVWHPFHPIIKHIWTGSFVFYVGSFSIFLLAIFYLIIDVWKVKNWSRMFIIIGANAIVAYVAWHLFDFKHISDIFIHGLQPYTGAWFEVLRNIGAFTVLLLLLWFMFRKKIFVKV